MYKRALTVFILLMFSAGVPAALGQTTPAAAPHVEQTKPAKPPKPDKAPAATPATPVPEEEQDDERGEEPAHDQVLLHRADGVADEFALVPHDLQAEAGRHVLLDLRDPLALATSARPFAQRTSTSPVAELVRTYPPAL